MPVTQHWEAGDWQILGAHWLISLAEMTSFRFSKRPHFKGRSQSVRTGHPMSLASAHKFTSVCTPHLHIHISHTHGHTNTHTLEGSYRTRDWAEIRRLGRERMDSGIFRKKRLGDL